MGRFINSVISLGMGALIFYGGIRYERSKTAAMPYCIEKTNGSFFFVDKENNIRYKPEKVKQVYEATSRLVDIMKEDINRKQSLVDRLESDKALEQR